MTASPPSPPPPHSPSPSADELASAYLDGEVTPIERTQVETDPTLLARVDELRVVRETLAAPVDTPEPGQRDAAIRAAMDASADLDGPMQPEPPVELASRRRSPGRSGRIGLAVLGAVAAAAIVVVAVSTTRTGDDTTSSARLAPAVASAPAGPTVAGGSPATTAAGGATTTAAASAAPGATDAAAPSADAGRAAASLPALGVIDDADALRTALATPSAPLAAAEASAAAEPCAVTGGQLVATVVWQGTPAFVYVDSAGQAEVVSQVDCVSLAEVPLS